MGGYIAYRLREDLQDFHFCLHYQTYTSSSKENKIRDWIKIGLKKTKFVFYFSVLLTVHLVTVFANNELEAHLFFFIFVYFNSLHVSGNQVLIIRRVNCINTTSGVCHCM